MAVAPRLGEGRSRTGGSLLLGEPRGLATGRAAGLSAGHARPRTWAGSAITQVPGRGREPQPPASRCGKLQAQPGWGTAGRQTDLLHCHNTVRWGFVRFHPRAFPLPSSLSLGSLDLRGPCLANLLRQGEKREAKLQLKRKEGKTRGVNIWY